MGKLKVLKLTVMFAISDNQDLINEAERLNDHYVLHDVIYNRDGIYLLGNDCWFECNGKAWKADKELFNHYLHQLIYKDKRMRRIEFDSLRIVRKSNPSLLTGETLKRYQMEWKLYNDRKQEIDIGLNINRFLKEINEE